MKTYFARLRKDDTERGQTLATHLQGVAQHMEIGAKALGLTHIARLIGLLHDLGKCSKAFADYLAASHAQANFHSSKRVDHSSAGGLLLWERYGKTTDPMEKLTIELAAMAIFSHHAGLQNFLGKDASSDFLRRLEKEQLLKAVDLTYFYAEVISTEALDKLFHEAVVEVQAIYIKLRQQYDTSQGVKKGDWFIFTWGMVQKYLLSLLIDADRLDSAVFAYQEDLTQDWHVEKLWPHLTEKLETAMEALPAPQTEYAQKIADLRTNVSEACAEAATKEPGFYRLAVPTGGGKTFASLRFALRHAKLWHKKRIIIIIPYTSIIDQNAKEIRRVLEEDAAILEFHANVLSEEVKKNSPKETEAFTPWQGLWSQRWDVPIILTTQVQFLDTIFSGRNTPLRRLRALEDSILIFDEVQTLPTRCTYLFNLAMNFLKDFCHVTALFCTATPPPLDMQKLDHPLADVQNLLVDTKVQKLFTAFQRVHIENICRPHGYSAEDIAQKLYEDTQQHGSALCIVNLRNEARDIYHALEALVQTKDIALYHLSTRMCPAHRKKVLATMREALQSGAQKIICVSTQLVEAGVDISFPVIYRALAGFPSLAQAAGRCNRHGELGEHAGRVCIFNFTGEELKSLPDIDHGKAIASYLLKKDSNADEILSPSVMDKYFKKFYGEYAHGDELAYHLEEKNRVFNLIDLLSANTTGCRNWADKDEENELQLCLHQAFRDAGEYFAVIDDKTTTVLVPYDKGKNLLAIFDEDLQGKVFGEAMRQAQQYAVNLFDYDFTALEKQDGIHITQSGALILRERFYDEKLGVCLTPKRNEVMCV